MVSDEERDRRVIRCLLQYVTLAKQSEHGDFSAAHVVHRSANRQFLLFHKVSQYGEVSRRIDACNMAFCRLAVVRSPLAPAIAGWMY